MLGCREDRCNSRSVYIPKRGLTQAGGTTSSHKKLTLRIMLKSLGERAIRVIVFSLALTKIETGLEKRKKITFSSVKSTP